MWILPLLHAYRVRNFLLNKKDTAACSNIHMSKTIDSCRVTKDCKNVQSRIDGQFFCFNTLYTATVNEISECCMCINTTFFIPLNSRIELLIPFKVHTLSVPVRVKGHLLTVCEHDVMSVEVLKPSREYLDFVKSINVDA